MSLSTANNMIDTPGEIEVIRTVDKSSGVSAMTQNKAEKVYRTIFCQNSVRNNNVNNIKTCFYIVFGYGSYRPAYSLR